MTQLFFDRDFSSPFDILVKDFFKKDSLFDRPTRQVVTHPIDVFETESGLVFEIACAGLNKDEVDINIEGDVLKVSHDKKKTDSEENVHYYHSGISRRSFNFGWKVSRRFDLSKAEASMDLGLLTLSVPYAKDSKPKSITIK
tara:strand:- start:1725 stop:2150 length:426 start_codon:yes stop_codon:yes gene_type:complete